MIAEVFAESVNWNLIFTGLMALATAMMWWDARKQRVMQIGPTPVPVTKVWPAASLSDLKEAVINLKDSVKTVKDRVDMQDAQIGELREILRVEIPEMERRISAAGELRVGKIHDRINDVLREVAKLDGQMQRP